MNKWDLNNWKEDVRHKSRCQLQLHQALCRRHRSLGCCMIARRTAAFTSQVGYRMRNKLSTPRRRCPQQCLPEASRAINKPRIAASQARANNATPPPPCSASAAARYATKALCNTKQADGGGGTAVEWSNYRNLVLGLVCRDTPSLGAAACVLAAFSGASSL